LKIQKQELTPCWKKTTLKQLRKKFIK
jgi:hypothetical protein